MNGRLTRATCFDSILLKIKMKKLKMKKLKCLLKFSSNSIKFRGRLLGKMLSVKSAQSYYWWLKLKLLKVTAGT